MPSPARSWKDNQATVCPLAKWLDDDLLQAVAAENNLSKSPISYLGTPRTELLDSGNGFTWPIFFSAGNRVRRLSRRDAGRRPHNSTVAFPHPKSFPSGPQEPAPLPDVAARPLVES